MSIGQDWWRWDDDFNFWRAILGDGTTEPVPVDPDPDPDPDDPFPDPTGRQVLLVTESGTLGTGNQALHDILVGDGWTVTVRALADPEDFADVSVLVMSAGNPDQDAGAYMFPPVGVVAVDSWRRLGMGAGLGYATSPLDVTVVDTSSPLAAGYSGTFPAYLSAAWLTWKPETDGALQTVVTRAGQPTERVVFAYEAGSQMPGRYATTRHVGLGYHQDGFAAGLTSQAQAQFLAAVRWARDTTVAPLPVPAAPSGLTAAPGDSQVRLSWSAAAYAETYTPRRAAVTGGPYTALATQVSATSYTDSTAVNDTPYFYVVSGKNASGEGPNSAEVSATPSTSAVESLSMLVSTRELAMWQDRAINGPFRVSGDFSVNSPGHWAEMQACMARAPFDSERWDGPVGLNSDGSVAVGGGRGNNPDVGTRRMSHDMMSAAYAALITGNNAVAQAVTNEMEWQINRPTMQYSDRDQWPYSTYNDLDPLFGHALWLKDFVLAYSVTKSMGFQSNIIESQFLALADLCEQSVHNSLKTPFPNRRSDSYVSRASWVDGDHSTGSHRLADGTIIYFPSILRWYNNRRNNLAGFYGLVGAMFGDEFFIAEFKRYMREMVMFGCRLGTYGGYGDYNRARNTFPALGWSYTVHGLESCLPAMDALARQGDTDLYEFATTDGTVNASWGTAGSKTMETMLDGILKFPAQTWPAQYSTSTPHPPSSSIAGDPYYLATTSRNSNTGNEVVNDGNLLLAANYYNRSDWTDIIMRQGTPTGFTSTPQWVGRLSGWRADWRARFLWSLDANPYGGS